jgi:UDP:flavonoid glycosyltransferase YjiC (YdhE family)
MTILLIPLGSHGDVHPLVGIGIRLRQRGHRVRVIVNEHFESLLRGAELEMVTMGTDAEYRAMAGRPELWHRMRGPKAVMQSLGHLLRPTYELIERCNEPGQTVVVGSSLAFGARVAQEKLGIPGATIHLQPLDFRSYVAPPLDPGTLLYPGTPHWLKAFQFWAMDAVVDRWMGPSLNAFRAELGLAPVKCVIRDWWNSPQRVIGMFPQWYAPQQPDWPPQTRLTGFPLYDERGVTALTPELIGFLNTGDAPIAFTFGSAMWHAKKILETSAQACAKLGKRGILLTRHREQVPDNLPAGVIHADFAPFSELLPRCAALVHHGGIGTAAQGLAAGVPHLVMPHAHDQPDNAARLMRLGVARKLEPRQFRLDRVAQELQVLLESSEVARTCRQVASRFVDVDPIGQTCELIEGVFNDHKGKR